MKTKLFLTAITSIIISTAIIFYSCEKDKEESNQNTCSITSPNPGDKFEKGDTIIISVEIDNINKKLKDVRFYIDGVGVSSTKSFPFTYEWKTYNAKIDTHTIKVKAIYDGQAAAEDEIEVIVTGIGPVANFEANTTEIISGKSVYFMDLSEKNPTNWMWDFGDGGTSSLQNPTHIYSTPGTYTVTQIVKREIYSDTLTRTNYIKVEPVNCPSTVTDYDGNTYKVVKIGNQCWMAENLATKHYADGTPIPHITDNTTWHNQSETDKAWCYPSNSSSNGDTYGALYTWAAAMNEESSSNSNPSGVQGICPDGWHLPSGNEWEELADYLGGYSIAGVKLKEKGTTLWKSPNEGATNSSGFSGRPSGFRDTGGSFYDIGETALFWSSYSSGGMMADRFKIFYQYKMSSLTFSDKEFGFSVRCVKNN